MTVTPMIVMVGLCFYGTLLWTLYVSFTKSGLLPSYEFAGLVQYERLARTPRWWVAVANMFILGGLGITISMLFGTFLAILLDQKVRAEGVFRTAFLYPQALSFIVTGLAWQWFLNPQMGFERFVRGLGFESFQFDWITDRDKAIYTIAFALIWHSSGLVMAMMLAGLRSIDGDVWRAIRVEGIPKWRAYVSIILPMLRPMIVTNIVMMAIAVVKSYDLVVAMTKGGPGNATDVPGLFVVDYAFERANLGLASAAAVAMLLMVAALLGPYFYFETRRSGR
ncbi:MAG: sugar ABC transporter permease [Rhodovulum sulfidophilum]|uniref:Sugar ABC transporter permease n=1 Tax=Rhodovulum sulfidophilum TaxID=35806 RepID=A0A2W5N3X3_RHOSU|nr:MAG: sugar ABC transporter permease [Rhodovulum sulfidophilum]